MLLECHNCAALVEVKEISAHVVPPLNGCAELWTFAACPQCKKPMLAAQFDFGEGFDRDTPIRVYPPQGRRLGLAVPQPIREAFEEAVVCFKCKAYTACAIMCRKTLEGLCSEHGARERTLGQSLQKLRDAGVIESQLFEWAEELRQLGNVAAHGVEVQTTRDDASDILEFTEAIAEYVFTYRERFASFKSRRTK